MKKYKYIFIIALIIFIVPNIVNAAPADDACTGKVNGAACEYNEADSATVIKGYCDRTGTFGSGALYCNKDVKGWEDCFFLEDACALDCKVGVCSGTSNGSKATCDTTTKYPPGNPGGSTPPKCGANSCGDKQVCVNNAENKPTCTANVASADGKCGANPCSAGQVCVNNAENKPTCTASTLTAGTKPASCSATTTPTPTPSPQTITFNNPIKFDTIPKLIAGIINALLGILGAITVAVLVISGFKYMTSSNPGEVGQALDGIKNAVIGLIIIMGAFLITQYVISALAV